MATIVDRAYLDIDGEILVCNSLTEDIDPSVKEIEGMTRNNRILGHSQGNPKLKLTAEVAMDADSSLDLGDMCLSKTYFSAGVEYEGGQSISYIDCVITKCSIKSKQGDHVNYDLEISARDRVVS